MMMKQQQENQLCIHEIIVNSLCTSLLTYTFSLTRLMMAKYTTKWRQNKHQRCSLSRQVSFLISQQILDAQQIDGLIMFEPSEKSWVGSILSSKTSNQSVSRLSSQLFNRDLVNIDEIRLWLDKTICKHLKNNIAFLFAVFSQRFLLQIDIDLSDGFFFLRWNRNKRLRPGNIFSLLAEDVD